MPLVKELPFKNATSMTSVYLILTLIFGPDLELVELPQSTDSATLSTLVALIFLCLEAGLRLLVPAISTKLTPLLMNVIIS